MANHDYIIDNQTFPATRTDLNNALSAIVTNNSSSSEPSTTYAYQWWYDISTTTLKFRNADNDAWVSFATFDMSNDTVNFLDSTVTITGLATTATGTTFTLSDTDNKTSVDFIIDNEKKVKFREATSNGTNSISLKAPASLASDVTFTLPSADGTADQVLKTDGSGNLSFTDVSGGTSWQSSIKTSAFTAVAGEGYWCNTTSAAFTVTLPASANVGDTIAIVDYAGTFATNNITLTSSLNIEGGTDDRPLTTNREGVSLTYADATQGWVATSGINSGDQAIDPVIYSADFLVIAGGGSGAAFSNAGGGGAGGYRESTQSLSAGTTYTITVGDGGATASGGTLGNDGSNSSISGSGLTTITSAGGGGGGTSGATGKNGGCGGGGGNGQSGGSGNTPSTSPSQGNNGGTGVDGGAYGGGGGGGAGAVGQDGTTSKGGDGGAGTASSITGSSVTRAGGGGGGTDTTIGSGGTGGGGDAGAHPSGDGGAGTVNTGSGGGGCESGSTSGAGGKGVVILSMPDANYSGTTTGSPTVATGVSGKTVLTFTGTGSYTG